MGVIILGENLLELEDSKKRFEMYQFLSFALLNEPGEELIKMLEDGKSLFKYMNLDLEFLDLYSIEEFRQEYYDRFFVPTSGIFVPPYESAIRGRKLKEGKLKYGKLDSEQTFHVKACYEMVDFKTDELQMFKPLKGNNYPDHLAFEMCFLSALVNYEVLALEDGSVERSLQWRKLQRDFLRDHTSKWIYDYSDLVAEKKSGLYSFICNLIGEWIDEDMEFLSGEEN